MRVLKWFASINISALALVPGLPQRCAPEPPPPATGCDGGGCALRVNPAAASDGSGSSWADPRNDVQAAIDAQATRGGGEVWVLGGDFLLGTSSAALQVPSHVTLRGAFAGSESAPEQRSSTTPATSLAASAGDPRLRIVGQEDVVVDRFRFVEVTINDSKVRMQGVHIASGDSPPDFNGSDVALVDSSLTGTPYGIRLTNARVVCDRVASAQPVYVGASSRLFVLDSRFTEHTERGSAIFLEGRPESPSVNATIVGSEFTTGGPNSTIGGTGDAAVLVFNSSFVDAISTHVGGVYPAAAAIGCGGEVSLSTFSNFWCGNSPYACNWATNAVPNNSLFLPPYPELTAGQPVPPPELFEAGSEEGIASNCAHYLPVSTSEPLCPDAGDAALLEQSRQRVLLAASQFEGFPFHLDLSRYASPGWWQNETTRADGSGPPDDGAPDPGRHFSANR